MRISRQRLFNLLSAGWEIQSFTPHATGGDITLVRENLAVGDMVTTSRTGVLRGVLTSRQAREFVEEYQEIVRKQKEEICQEV